MSIAIGFICPGCGQGEKASITHWVSSTEFVLHCPRCEQVWTEKVLTEEGP
jgi:uncharacterized Zn finger protein